MESIKPVSDHLRQQRYILVFQADQHVVRGGGDSGLL